MGVQGPRCVCVWVCVCVCARVCVCVRVCVSHESTSKTGKHYITQCLGVNTKHISKTTPMPRSGRQFPTQGDDENHGYITTLSPNTTHMSSSDARVTRAGTKRDATRVSSTSLISSSNKDAVAHRTCAVLLRRVSHNTSTSGTCSSLSSLPRGATQVTHNRKLKWAILSEPVFCFNFKHQLHSCKNKNNKNNNNNNYSTCTIWALLKQDFIVIVLATAT